MGSSQTEKQASHKRIVDAAAAQIRRDGPYVVLVDLGSTNGTKVNGQFQFNRDKTVYVNHYYFYIDDEDFGPLFIKVCSYAPWGIKVCLNGHEWAKRQLDKRSISYEALDNGFLSCAEPEQLQQICDSLGPEQMERLFRKWLKRIPLPLRATSASDCPSCEAIRNVSMGNCRLAATATTLEPRFAMSRSPAASARTTSAPLSKRRHSMRSPVARSNVPSTMPDFAGSTPVT